jgi:hypothetical protein
MKTLIVTGIALTLVGCAAKDQLYYDATKSISKDNTMTQTACWASVTEMSKSAEASVRIAALALAKECKSDAPKIEPPKKNILGF